MCNTLLVKMKRAKSIRALQNVIFSFAMRTMELDAVMLDVLWIPSELNVVPGRKQNNRFIHFDSYEKGLTAMSDFR